MTAEHFLRGNPRPSREEIRPALVDNTCRCAGYQFIVNAFERAVCELAATSHSK